MSQDSVERLLGRLLTDASFRADAEESLSWVCRREGYDLTEGELRLVVRINTAGFEPIAAHLDPRLCRAGSPPDVQTRAGRGGTIRGTSFPRTRESGGYTTFKKPAMSP